jgi:hypothetical protein
MPVLDASALEADPEGVRFLRDVLGAGSSLAPPIDPPHVSERFAVQSRVSPEYRPTRLFCGRAGPNMKLWPMLTCQGREVNEPSLGPNSILRFNSGLS